MECLNDVITNKQTLGYCYVIHYKYFIYKKYTKDGKNINLQLFKDNFIIIY